MRAEGKLEIASVLKYMKTSLLKENYRISLGQSGIFDSKSIF